MNETWDVAVVGGGGAGLAAAVSAAERGAKVILFESQKELGGSTQESAGMFTAAGTSVQAGLGLADSPERFFQHYMDLNQWKLKPSLIREFCVQAAPTLEWLLGLGVEIPAKRSGNAHSAGLCQAGVEDVWRGHVPVDQGYGIVQVLAKAAKAHRVDVVLDSPVQDLLTDETGAARGVKVDSTELCTKGVVVATGGLASNSSLVARYYPEALAAGDALFVVATPGAQGDHLRFAEGAGAAVTGKGWGLLLITAVFQRYHHWRSGFPPPSRVYVNKHGRRFMNEDASYAVASGIFQRNGGYAWAIFDQKAVDGLPIGNADWNATRITESVERGESFRSGSLGELAELIGVPRENFQPTIERWNAQMPAGEDPDFLRHESLRNKGLTDRLEPIATGPFYAVKMVPGELVCTHTGIEIDGRARALNSSGEVIPRLFAAGEAGAGVLGERYVGGGNSIANALTMGRLAGAEAASVA